jgi:hypothetical protein
VEATLGGLALEQEGFIIQTYKFNHETRSIGELDLSIVGKPLGFKAIVIC